MKEYYVFTLEALNDIGPSDASKTNNITLTKNAKNEKDDDESEEDPSVPSKPLNVTKVKDNKGNWTITFDKPESEGSSKINDYGVKLVDLPDEKIQYHKKSPIQLDLTPSYTGTIQVFARNNFGKSEYVDAVEPKKDTEAAKDDTLVKDKPKDNGSPSQNTKVIAIGLSSIAVLILLFLLFRFLYNRFTQPPPMPAMIM